MKKIIPFIILILIQPWNNVDAQETLYHDREITEEFHCPTFKAALYQMKIISDTSRIMYSEVRDVKELRLIATYPRKENREILLSITSFAGLEFFTNLEAFTFRGWGGRDTLSLNLSKNKHLKRINLFDYPKVDTLDISLCESLETLYCTSSVLNYLKTGNQKKLKNMTVQSQTLSTIDLSGLVNLDTLDCQSCRLTELNLAHNPVLSYLNCSYNRLCSLDLRKNHHLKTLMASKQAGKFTLCESGRTGCLTKLLLPDNTTSHTGIIQLRCDDNKLEYIDFSKSPYLESINCTFNRLKELNTHHNPSLKELICSFNYIALLDLTNNPLLQKIDCSSQGYEWIQQKNKDYRLLKKLLLFHDINGENKQLKELIYSQTGLIQPIKFEQYPNLYYLDCYDNQIRSLNLQHNKELKILCCSHNKMRTINIYHNKKLENLYCSYNKIRSLNVTNNPHLKKLDICKLPIRKLDLSENPLINEISCNDFPLREHQEKKESRKKLTIRFNETMSAMTIYSIIQHISRKLDIRRGEGKLSLTL